MTAPLPASDPFHPEEAVLPAISGLYAFDLASYNAPAGADDCARICERRVRDAARKGGHSPVGRVDLTWSKEINPETGEQVPGRIFGAAAVRVVLDAEKNREARATYGGCPLCGATRVTRTITSAEGSTVHIYCARCGV